ANGTINALEYCREVGATLCLASTNKVYPIHDDGRIWVKKGDRWTLPDFENGIPVDARFAGARTPYGNSKMAADLLCQEWSHTYKVRTGIFRMSCVAGEQQFGFEEQGWLSYFVIAAMKGWPITIFGDGCQVRDVLNVEDCVKAYDAFVVSERLHGLYNLGGGPVHTTSLNEHVDFLEHRLSRKIETAFADWRPLDQKAYISNIDKLYDELGWYPTVTVEQTTERIIEWVANNVEIF
ncbi:MAG: NAD-dependent epimerase/dehydratase family protein, partial [Nitrososphaera sp.]|nr:NAD-dependent epimerase/dehydratase family protein [Nitrososphaera sp.]